MRQRDNPTDGDLRPERSFGVMLGTVLTLAGAWWLWTDAVRSLVLPILAGGVCVLAMGLLLPRALTPVLRLWLLLRKPLGALVTRVVLASIFYLVVTPTGVAKRLTGWDPLLRRSSPSSGWQPYSPRQRDAKHFEKMY